MAFSEDERFTIWLVDAICASISIVCCLFICITYCCYPSLRGYEFRLIFYLTFSDMLASMVYAVPPHGNDQMCKVQGALLTLTANLRLAFSAVIANSIRISNKSNQDFFKKYELKCLIVITVMCIVCANLPFSTDNYGQAEGLCWISVLGDKYIYGTVWRFSLLYIPLWIVLIYNCVIYYKVIRMVRSLRSSCVEEQNYINQVVKKLLLYPLILTIGWLPATINRIIGIFEPNSPNVYLSCFSFGLISGIGFFNAIAYGFTPAVQHTLYTSWCGRKSITDNYTQISVQD